MRNFLGHSNDETLTAPYDVASGGGALVGATFGVAKTNLKQGERGAFSLVGKFELPKDGNAAAEGVRAYWDDANKRVTAMAGGTLIGVFAVARLAGAGTAPVRLNGSF